MPLASDVIANEELLARTLCYGPAKSKKTWWALKAAEAGFNVLIVNGDDGIHIVKQINKEALRRIRIIDCYDSISGAVMYDLVARLLRGDKVIWDDQIRKCLRKIDPAHDCFVLEASKLTAADVLIIDSWTALCWSFTVQGALEKNIDLSEGEKGDNPWELYGDTGRQLDWCLNRLKSLPCHVVVIGHVETYEKTRKKGKDIEVIFTRQQPISSSRPHGQRLSKYFSDVLFFKMVGNQFRIDTSAEDGRDGGSRVLVPKNWNWDELTFAAYAKEALMKIPALDQPMPGCEFVPAGTIQSEPMIASENTQPILQATPASNAGKPTGLSALIKRSS